MFFPFFLSIIGAVLVIVGLYILLWGKEGDVGVRIKAGEQSHPTYDEATDPNKQKITSAEKDIAQGEP